MLACVWEPPEVRDAGRCLGTIFHCNPKKPKTNLQTQQKYHQKISPRGDSLGEISQTVSPVRTTNSIALGAEKSKHTLVKQIAWNTKLLHHCLDDAPGGEGVTPVIGLKSQRCNGTS